MYKQIITGLALTCSAIAYTSDISLLTYNIRRAGSEKHAYRQWNRRKAQLCNAINGYNADIICLQEVTPEQLHYLRHGLNKRYGCVCTTGRGKSWGANEAVPVFYNTSRFSVIKTGTFRLNKLHKGIERFKALFRPKKHGLLPRICSWALLKETASKQTILVCNTHLDNKYEQARINGLKKISHCVQALQSQYKPDAVFLMGDFNTELNGKITRYTASFINAKKQAQKHTGPAYAHPGWDHDQNSNIDHILLRAKKPTTIKEVEVIDHSPTGLLLSDHWPVKAHITIA